MARVKGKNYWLWQLAGWGLLGVFSVSVAITFNQYKPNYIFVVAFYLVVGFLLSHLMRYSIIKGRFFQKPIPAQVGSIILLSIVTALIASLLQIAFDNIIDFNEERSAKYSFLEQLTIAMLNNYMVFFVWNLIYFSYYHIQKNRHRELDNLRLESLVKNLELQTIKSHINPHFIFNSLNSIRALVDEDPQRARTAITELSKILRSSLNAEKYETTTLEQELEIVNDYLALEKLRFEERLNIIHDIDPDTLQEPVPPMMLQTLVENAIKHGVSKEISGGTVEVSSHYSGNTLVLNVRNSGTLAEPSNESGFGIRGTKERLNYLYGGKANFDIKELPGNIVESSIILPIKISKNTVYV